LSLLVTGFGPFLDVTDNPSAAIATSLDGARVAGLTVHARVLPVSFDRAAASLGAAIAELEPRSVLLLGVHRGDTWRLERRARPRITSEHPDVDAVQAPGRVLGPAERTTAIDVPGLARALGAGGHEVVISDDCGGYVCNSTYYSALGARPDALFVHVPDAGAAGVELGRVLALAILEALSDLAPGAAEGPSATPLAWVDDAEVRYRIHLLALSGRAEELLPGYRRTEERLRLRLPKIDVTWRDLGDALGSPSAPPVDREWFATRDAAEAPAIARTLAARRPAPGSPFSTVPTAFRTPGAETGVRVIVSGAGRPEPALVPSAAAVVCGHDTPTPLAWLAAAALPFAARIQDAAPRLPAGARRFAAMMLAGAAHAIHLPTEAVDTLLEAFVSTLLPPQHRGRETVAWLEACRDAGLLPEHPGEFERMCHGIPRRRHDRIHRAWIRGSFRAP
jgi:pyroglutamyl-peptidase